MTTSVFPAYVDAFKSALGARLPGVRISKEPIGENPPKEFIEVDSWDADFQAAALPNGLDEEGRLLVGVKVLKPGQNEAISASARARCVALISEMQTMLVENSTLGVEDVNYSRVAHARIEQSIEPDGRVCAAAVEVFVRARIN